MGRTPRVVTKTFTAAGEEPITLNMELFTWEKLDYVEAIKRAFNIG